MAFLAVVSSLVLFLAAGCGGGGGGGALGGINVFLSDDMSTGFDHIWVTVYQVEARDTNGSFHTVYSSADGVVLDVTALNDGAPRFLYLGNNKAPTGDYNGARVTMARSLTVVATGSPTGEACTFDPSLNFGTDKSQAVFNFGADDNLSGNDSVVVDFDLPNWVKNGTVVTPAFTKGDDSTLGDHNRHDSEDYHGTVSDLAGTAPDQTFTLRKEGGDLGVTTDSGTVVYNEDSSPDPHLAGGQKVEVSGKFDTATNRLIATVIKIESSTSDDTKVEGPTSNLDTVGLTVDVEAREVEGFTPADAVVHVHFTETTRFFSKAGSPLTLSEILVLLATNVAVEAEGTYDAGSNTLTASKMKLHQEDGEDHEAEARGTVSNINAGGGTFDLTLASWYGFSAASGSVVHIATNGDTEFKGANDESLSSDAFFTALQNGASVEVTGTFDAGTITATEVKLDDNGGGGDGAEAKGYVTASDEGAGTVTVNLIEWFGFNGSFGGSQVIQTNGSTTFQDADGNSITSAQFFAGLVNGHVVDAEGSFAAGVLTATRARLRD